MAFQLGSFIVQLLGDTSHLDGALRGVQGAAQNVGKAVSGVSGTGLKVPGADAAKAALQGANEAAQSLGGALRKLLDIDLSTVLQLGTIAGATALLGTMTKKFMELQDEAKNMQFRFRVLGMETEENTKKVFAFGKQMQESFGVGQAEARKLSMDALTKGINPGRYQEMTASAVQLGAALGISSQRALSVVEQLEAGNTMVLRRLHPSFRILMEQGASRHTLEQKVNEMIAQGGSIAKERMNTFEGQIGRLKNAFSNLSVSVANAIGPAFAPIVSKAADALEHLTKKVEAYIKANQETIGATIRAAAGVAAGAAAFLLFRNQIGGVLGMVHHLIPSVGSLWSTFQMGYNVAPFGFLKRAILGLTVVIKQVVLYSLIGGLKIALNLFNPINLASTLCNAALLLWKAHVVAAGAAAGIAAVGARLLAIAIRGVLFATGIGILVGLIGMFMGMADTFGNTSTEAEGFGAIVKRVFHEFRDVIEPVLHWLRTEGEIIFRALIASARSMVEGIVELWGQMGAVWDQVVGFLKSNFGEAVTWVESTFGVKIDSIKSMWEEFTAELAVLGLRMKQVFLIVIIEIAKIPTVVSWLGECFKAFANYVRENWLTVLIGGIMTYFEYLKLLGTALMDIGDKIGKALSGESVTFDFSSTQAQFDRLKNQAKETLAGIKMPHLDTSHVAPELKGELDKVSGEIDRRKQSAREAQAAARLNAQNRGTGKTDDQKGGDPKANVLIGSRDKAHFQETVGFWKKVQEAGAGQRAEYFMQQQLDQQREMVRLLSAIREASMVKPPPGGGGVTPR